MKTIIALLLFITNCFSQHDELMQLFTDGQKAYESNDFVSAKKIFLHVLELDSINKNAFSNLSAIELNMGNTEAACEYLYKSYRGNNLDASQLIKQYCPTLRNGTIVLMEKLDTPMKFIYKTEEFPLFIGDRFNQKYIKIISGELKKSPILNGKAQGKLGISIHISKDGIFDGEIKTLNVEREYNDVV